MTAPQGGKSIGLAWDIGGDIVRFPLWWYGVGLVHAAQYVVGFVQGYARKLGFMVWVKNIFTPMFGRYDWQSRLISVFMRAMNIIFRGFAVCMVAVIGLFGFAVYVALPIAAVVFALFHLTAFLAV
jgi:hypothetical protein